MFERGVAVVYVTKRGRGTAFKVKEALEKAGLSCKLFAPEKYASNGVLPLRPTFLEGVKELFSKFNAIVAVAATGIIIRAVAPLLKSKFSDPAVVCVDVVGRFVISLISGHHGKANFLARLIADGIGAVPVITTATEAIGRKSVEDLAKKLRCDILNPEVLKELNSLIVNDGKVVIVYIGRPNALPRRIYGYEAIAAEGIEKLPNVLRDFEGGVLIARKVDEEVLRALKGLSKPVALLRPKRIAMGIGARKNIRAEDVCEAVTRALRAIGVPLFFVEKIATVETKKDSSELINAADKLGIPVQFISIEELKGFNHQDLSPDSDLVKEKIGVGGVCERAALIAIGGKGRLILRKMKMNGVTVAVAEAEWS
jgi:cobalt-precorrin 5A hydrolase